MRYWRQEWGQDWDVDRCWTPRRVRVWRIWRVVWCPRVGVAGADIPVDGDPPPHCPFLTEHTVAYDEEEARQESLSRLLPGYVQPDGSEDE